MQNIIFLSTNQKEVLDLTGLDVSCLLPDVIGDYFSAADICYIKAGTVKSLEEDGVLSQYLFSNGELTEWYHGREIIPTPKNSQLSASCPNSETIVIWPEESTVSANIMLQRNLGEFVKAMSKVMTFKDVAKSKQFELLIQSV